MSEGHAELRPARTAGPGEPVEQAFQRLVDKKEDLQAILTELYKAVGVDSWEKLQGQYVRVRLDDGIIRQVGHVLEDRWTTDPRPEQPTVAERS